MREDKISNNQRITFVIPTFNRKHTINRAIDSILYFYPFSFIIIVDDSSTDNTYEHILEYYNKLVKEKKLFIHKNDTNKGVNASRNIGLSFVENGWVFFLDSDDEIIYNHKLLSELSLYDKIPVILYRCQTKNGDFIGKKNVATLFIDSKFYLNNKIGEVLLVVNKNIVKNDFFNANYNGYELLSVLSIADEYGVIVLSNIVLRTYHNDQKDRLSNRIGFLPRLSSIKKGHLDLLKKYISILNPQNIIKYAILILLYSIIDFIYRSFPCRMKKSIKK